MSLKFLLLPALVSVSLLGGDTQRSMAIPGVKLKSEANVIIDLKPVVWTYSPNKAPVPSTTTECHFESRIGRMKGMTYKTSESFVLLARATVTGDLKVLPYSCNKDDAQYVPALLINGGSLKDVYLVYFPDGPQFVPALAKSVAEITSDGIVFH